MNGITGFLRESELADGSAFIMPRLEVADGFPKPRAIELVEESGLIPTLGVASVIPTLGEAEIFAPPKAFHAKLAHGKDPIPLGIALGSWTGALDIAFGTCG
jgi:hypothetical protein